MNALELTDRVETDLRMMGFTPPGPADILRYLNEANDETSVDLHIPTRYVKEVVATAPFLAPLEARPGQIRFAEDSKHNSRIKVLTVSEANNLYPDWEMNVTEGEARYGHKLIIYDPSNVTAPIYPVGFTTGEKLRMQYTMKPKPMVFSDPLESESLEPWNGVMPEYHRIVANEAVFKLAMLMSAAEGNEFKRGVAQAYLAKNQGDKVDAFAYSRADYVVLGSKNLTEV